MQYGAGINQTTDITIGSFISYNGDVKVLSFEMTLFPISFLGHADLEKDERGLELRVSFLRWYAYVAF